MVIYKHPTFTDDSYYLVIQKNDVLKEVRTKYYKLKREAFRACDASKGILTGISDSDALRPSLRGLDDVQNLQGTIYTVAAQLKQGGKMKFILDAIRENKDTSRRCLLNIADTVRDYLNDNIDTTCLTSIHYCEDNVKLFFRASDMENELLIDLHLIKEFFIDPVYGSEPVEIHVIASTAQMIINPKNILQ